MYFGSLPLWRPRNGVVGTLPLLTSFCSGQSMIDQGTLLCIFDWLHVRNGSGPYPVTVAGKQGPGGAGCWRRMLLRSLS
jgi:hypothetical protein